ncbi:MAG: hypothetical protein GEU78_15070 [Actinobacteria bacterium]|nr:hypothetical protein [Actinomycetota bacterium]
MSEIPGNEPNKPVAIVEALVTLALNALVVSGMVTEQIAVELGGAVMALVTAVVPFVHWAVTRQWTYSAARIEEDFLDAEMGVADAG